MEEDRCEVEEQGSPSRKERVVAPPLLVVVDVVRGNGLLFLE